MNCPWYNDRLVHLTKSNIKVNDYALEGIIHRVRLQDVVSHQTLPYWNRLNELSAQEIRQVARTPIVLMETVRLFENRTGKAMIRLAREIPLVTLKLAVQLEIQRPVHDCTENSMDTLKLW
jgi:hypothetical protein